jgi:hypothetical protein
MESAMSRIGSVCSPAPALVAAGRRLAAGFDAVVFFAAFFGAALFFAACLRAPPLPALAFRADAFPPARFPAAVLPAAFFPLADRRAVLPRTGAFFFAAMRRLLLCVPDTSSAI